MALIFDEKFENTGSPGYDETSTGAGSNWSETIGSTGIIDENFTVSSVTGAPSRWGTQCLKIKGGATTTRTRNTLDTAVTGAFYCRVDIVIDNITLTDGDYTFIVLLADSSDQVAIDLQCHRVGESYYLRSHVDGGSYYPSATGYGPIAFDTCYRWDAYYNGSGNAWEYHMVIHIFSFPKKTEETNPFEYIIWLGSIGDEPLVYPGNTYWWEPLVR